MKNILYYSFLTGAIVYTLCNLYYTRQITIMQASYEEVIYNAYEEGYVDALEYIQTFFK